MIPMAYGNEIKKRAILRAKAIDQQVMLLRQQQIAQQQVRAKRFNDGYRY